MAYDFPENYVPPAAPVTPRPAADPRDLEALVTVLELAVIDMDGPTFTRDALLDRALDWWGADPRPQRSDLALVLQHSGNLVRSAGPGLLRMR